MQPYKRPRLVWTFLSDPTDIAPPKLPPRREHRNEVLVEHRHRNRRSTFEVIKLRRNGGFAS